MENQIYRFCIRSRLPNLRTSFVARYHKLAYQKGTDPVIMRSHPSPVESLSVQNHFSWLKRIAPCFGINGRQVEIIKDPSVFYKTLIDEASKAKQRIVYSSLYLGTSPLEADLVKTIYNATAENSEADNSKLKVDILLDYTRGSRGQSNSRTMLIPLLKDFPEQVNISLYHSPDLRGLKKRFLPERYNEVVGLQHMKIYLVDDNVMLSGANLSESYFTNRQDRHVIIRQCRPLADFFHNLVSCISSMSFALKSDDTLELAEGLSNHPFEGPDNGADFRAEAKAKLDILLDPTRYNVDNSNDSMTQKKSSDSEIDTWIYPLVQLAPFGVSVDDNATQKLFEKAPKESAIKLASGYFNLTEHYMDTVVNKSVANYEILTAAPEANGFFGARGISGAIPHAYTYIAKCFHDLVCKSSQQNRIHLHEYSRDGWTFHAKGLWYYLPFQTMPSMSLIGSPNFGYRSVFRDLEAQAAIVTTNTHLRKQLHLEQNELYSRSSQVTSATFDLPSRRIPLWVTYVTPIIRHFF